jgi:YesN/AraC family two-component response regulator
VNWKASIVQSSTTRHSNRPRKRRKKFSKSLGYRVLSVSSGEMALEELSVQKDEIDLVLADVVMPGMSGVKLMSESQETVPEFKFILTSGYDLDTLESHPGLDIKELVEKPFRGASLSKAVKAKLDD